MSDLKTEDHTKRVAWADALPLPWQPGITDPLERRADCMCTWAYRDGRMEMKYRNRICPVAHRAPAPRVAIRETRV